VAVVSFVCSVGNIPLAAVLWNGGISFGGVIAFIFADLIILPILNIYRKYYGLRMAGFLFVTFYAAMAGAALVVELIFGVLGRVPAQRNARVAEASISWDYTTWLNIAFVILAGLLVWRFLKTGGPEMLRMMKPVSCDRTLPLEPTSCSRADESRLCARHHIPKAITTAPAKPNQVMAASISGPFHFRPANVAYWQILLQKSFCGTGL